MTTETFQDIIEDAEDRVRNLVQRLPEVLPEDLGLDNRSAYRLWVTDDGIIVTSRDDRHLQYYGGFEYVDKDYRMELGDWVFYSASDDRVQGHLDRYNEVEEEDIEAKFA
jgi:hypothetical protein